MIDRKLLIEKAFEAQENCYTPYSNFNVGAALLCENGDIYTGCNIENAAFTPTNCAERTASKLYLKDKKTSLQLLL